MENVKSDESGEYDNQTNGGESDALIEKQSTESVTLTIFEKVRNFFVDPGLQLSRIPAAFILASFAYGAGLIILPNTLLRLGPVTWTLLIAAVTTILCYTTYLNYQCALYLMSEAKTDDIRDPYPAIAELAGGRIFRRIVILILNTVMITSSVGRVLLSASMLNDTFAFASLHHYDSIRVWSTIICAIMTPLVYFGSFADLRGTAMFSIIASTITLVTIFTNCILLRYQYNVESPVVYNTPTPSDVFISFGLFLFTVQGPPAIVTNVAVHMSKVDNFPLTIAIMFGILFMIYVLVGSTPYVIFGKATEESITSTFKSFYPLVGDSVVVPVFTVVCNVCMSVHLLLAAILCLNPVYQYIECFLGVPKEMNWKKITVRTCGMLFIFVICMAFPAFRPILSIVGGVPVTLLGVIFPTYIHTKLFETSRITKVVHILIQIAVVVFMIGNLGYSIDLLRHSAFASIKTV